MGPGGGLSLFIQHRVDPASKWPFGGVLMDTVIEK